MKRNCAYTMTKTMLLLLSFLFVALSATSTERQSTHYIIAFDMFPNSQYREYYKSRDILKRLDTLLADTFNVETDYVSVVGYGLSLGDPSPIDDYARPYVLKKDTILWYQLGSESLYDLLRNWSYGMPSHIGSSEDLYSMQSLAKPFAVMATKNDSKYADRTILILVTDEEENGADNDYFKELKNSIIYKPTGKQIEPIIRERMAQFNEDFYFFEIISDSSKLKRTPISPDGQYQIIPYEVVATARPSIYSVTDLHFPLPLRRIRGGYKMNVDVSQRDKKYEIKEIVIANAKGNTLVKSSDGTLDFFIPSKNIADGDTLTVSMSILFKDGLYNGTLLSPRNDKYRFGMFNDQVFHIPNEAKVLGIIPLADMFWWWYPNNIVNAVIVWDLIILLILIIVIGYVLYRCFVKINEYRPDNNNLKITKV